MSLSFLTFRQLAKPWLVRNHRRFTAALNEPLAAQAKTLSRILELTGRSKLPEAPTEYGDLKDLNTLTNEKVRFFETTSGSGGAKKRIPYNSALIQAFESMFILWLADLLYFSGVPFSTGKFFMSISPQIGDDPVQDDSKHLSWPLRLLLRRFMVSPPDSHRAATTEEFFDKISKDLVACEGLEALSLWSPSYFLSILDHCTQNHLDWRSAWPNLKLISCWADGPSELTVKSLAMAFPNSIIQPKGLLATEGPFTLPWTDAKGSVPLIHQIYFEFLDSQGRILRLSQLKEGETYELLPSTPGGLLRYRIRDLVQVTRLYNRTPCFAFRGRAGEVSDLVGEKISPDLLAELFPTKPQKFLFLPCKDGDTHYYECWTDTRAWPAEEIEARLCQIHHYRLARTLRQLGPVNVMVQPHLGRQVLDFYNERGMRMGEIKEKLLIPSPKEAEQLRAFLHARSQPSAQS